MPFTRTWCRPVQGTAPACTLLCGDEHLFELIGFFSRQHGDLSTADVNGARLYFNACGAISRKMMQCEGSSVASPMVLQSWCVPQVLDGASMLPAHCCAALGDSTTRSCYLLQNESDGVLSSSIRCSYHGGDFPAHGAGALFEYICADEYTPPLVVGADEDTVQNGIITHKGPSACAIVHVPSPPLPLCQGRHARFVLAHRPMERLIIGRPHCRAL